MRTVLGTVTLALVSLTLWARNRNQRLANRSGDVTRQAVDDLNERAPGIGAKSVFLKTGDNRFHAIVAGPEGGPLVVLLHGFPEHWYSWRSQIPVLAKAGYRIVAPDQRGYNRSDKPTGVQAYRGDKLTADVMGIIHILGYDQAVIVGHDWGGVVAWRFAMDYPQAIKRLIVMNAPHPQAYQREIRAGWRQRRKSWYVLFFQLPLVPEALMRLSPLKTAQFFFRGTAVRTAAFSDRDLGVMAVALAQPGAMTATINWYRAAMRHPSPNPVRDIDVPTLLIWGEDDVALDKALTTNLERWVSDLQVHAIPSCGHWVQNEASDEVNETLLAFFEQ
ncbi:MAG: alpha/beta hydrolase [Anaerolineae bacterium]|nr:alpha/beta hydrolase [Anaerolineae bacterium]